MQFICDIKGGRYLDIVVGPSLQQYEEKILKQTHILNEKEKRRKKKPRYNDPD